MTRPSIPGDPWAGCPPPTCEDFAVILGAIFFFERVLNSGIHIYWELSRSVRLGYSPGRSPYKLYPKFTNDMDVVMALKTATDNLSTLPVRKRDVVFSEFCAKYLHKVVDDFIDPPLLGIRGTGYERILGPRYCELLNAWLIMLCSLAHLPYFVKYLRSTKPAAAPGKDLVNVVAKRILVLAERLDGMDQSDTDIDGPVVLYFDAFLNSIPLIYSVYSLSSRSRAPGRATIFRKEVKLKLLDYLWKWMDPEHNCREDVKAFSEYAYDILTADEERLRQARIRRKEQWGMSKCALPGCKKQQDLKGCARCRTAFYFLLQMRVLVLSRAPTKALVEH
ncbi:hypothetical protein BDN72DRAFT_860758 [Pluteus cervinus]|uniref:Uncharacterized protein n=1 Tax=Pluteus cervinus TaxID=181527 RepID=A0ACD3AHA9_9AGAR|nr:hypothetical protein BDN72DRAFT_860758 [Pluteus cervinus]